MDFLLYSKGTSETGKTLAEFLGIEGGTETPTEKVDTLIRWGSSLGAVKNPAFVLNKKVAVALAANKLESQRIMQNIEGINVPHTALISELFRGLQPNETRVSRLTSRNFMLPVLAREVHHTQGKDILLCLQEKDLERAVRWEKDFIVQYIPTAREYRIHVAMGEVIRTSQKVLMQREGYVSYLRNHENSHTYREVRDELREQDITAAIRAVTSLGLDFGAVDLIIGDDGRPYVLEVNTGPHLIENGVEIYGGKFKSILEQNRNVINERKRTTTPVRQTRNRRQTR